MNNAQELELPYSNELGPIVDECLELAYRPNEGKGDGLGDWINARVNSSELFLERQGHIKSGDWAWPDDYNFRNKLFILNVVFGDDRLDTLSFYAGMIKIGHPLIRSFNDTDKREMLKVGLSHQVEDCYRDIASMEINRAYEGKVRADFEDEKKFNLDGVYRWLDILSRLGARVTPSSDISRK